MERCPLDLRSDSLGVGVAPRANILSPQRTAVTSLVCDTLEQWLLLKKIPLEGLADAPELQHPTWFSSWHHSVPRGDSSGSTIGSLQYPPWVSQKALAVEGMDTTSPSSCQASPARLTKNC